MSTGKHSDRSSLDTIEEFKSSQKSRTLNPELRRHSIQQLNALAPDALYPRLNVFEEETLPKESKPTPDPVKQPVDIDKISSRKPVYFNCPCCYNYTESLVVYSTSPSTWLCAFLIFICGGFLGCFLIPFFTNACKEAIHSCKICDTIIVSVGPCGGTTIPNQQSVKSPA